jgi:hypothetical protein
MDMLFWAKLIMKCFESFFIGFVPVMLFGIFKQLSKIWITQEKLLILKERELGIEEIQIKKS